jgi:hypothetical protein
VRPFVIPFEDLRARAAVVAAAGKRGKFEDGSGEVARGPFGAPSGESASTAHPAVGAAAGGRAETATTAKPSKRQALAVRFDLDRNVVYELDRTPEDLAGAWLSWQESHQIRQQSLDCIAAYQVGATDNDHECLRGLEAHLDPELVQKRLDNSRKYTAVILNQQRFLRSVVGYCNENILSKMSSVLSHEDKEVALRTARNDAEEASRILAGTIFVDQDFSSLKATNFQQQDAFNRVIDYATLRAVLLRAQLS